MLRINGPTTGQIKSHREGGVWLHGIASDALFCWATPPSRGLFCPVLLDLYFQKLKPRPPGQLRMLSVTTLFQSIALLVGEGMGVFKDPILPFSECSEKFARFAAVLTVLAA